MCKLLQISRSSFYHWMKGSVSSRYVENLKFKELIHEIFMTSSQSYGAIRIRAELMSLGYVISRRRVVKIMNANGWIVRGRKKFKVTTDSSHTYPIAPNLLERQFDVVQPNRVWVSDITYVPTRKGWMYLTAIIDLYHRKVIGWSMSRNLTTTDTIMKAWKMAKLKHPITEKLIFHSDRGVQYASKEFRRALEKEIFVKQSMSRKGDCWDNAVAESFFKTLKVELVYNHKYKTIEEAELSIFEWIETWYNTKRRHSKLDYKNIKEIETELNNLKLVA